MISDDELSRKIRAVARTSAEQTSSTRFPTWRRLFELARILQAVDVPAEPDLLWLAASTWWEIAQPRQDSQDCYAELLRCYPRVLVPAGQTRLEVAGQLAKTEPLPVDALRYPTPRAQRLVALCYWLHSLAFPKPWFLSCRSAARAVGGSHMAASSLLGTLVRDGVLTKEQAGGQRATRYRYGGELRLTTEVLTLPDGGLQRVQRDQRDQRDFTERPERPENTEDNRRSPRLQIDTRGRAGARAREAGPESGKSCRGQLALTPAETSAAARAATEACRRKVS